MPEKLNKILIIDDTPANIQVLYEIFNQEYETYFATSGKDGIAIAHRELPDIILLDIMMPEMDGYEVCSLLKNDPATESIPVLFVTAMDEEEDETKGLALGAIDYVTKPISPSIVKARVKNHLELKLNRDSLISLGEELLSKNRIFEQQKALAHGLLGKILPEELSVPGFTTAVFFKPSDQIGGDFFDSWRNGNHAHFLIADISGHSISAALLMAVCKGLFMSLGLATNDPVEIVAAANRMLCRMLLESGMYLTMIYAVCDLEKKSIRILSAGHNPAYLFTLSGRIVIDSTGPPIGWDSDDSWDIIELPFASEDILLLYTDGLVETRSAEGLMMENDIFTGLGAASTPDEMVKTLLQRAEACCNAVFDDDVTIFAIGYKHE